MKGNSAGVGRRKTVEQRRAYRPSVHEEDVEAGIKTTDDGRPPEHLVEEEDMDYKPATPQTSSDDDCSIPDSASECRSPLPHSFYAHESSCNSDEEEENEQDKENAACNRSEGLPKRTPIPKLVSNVLCCGPFGHESDPISGGSEQSLRSNYSVKKMGMGHLPEATRKLATEPKVTASFPPRSPPRMDVRYAPASNLIAQWQEIASPVGRNSRGPSSPTPTRSPSPEKTFEINSEGDSEGASLTTFSSIHNLDDGSWSGSENGISSSTLGGATIETKEQDGLDSIRRGESPAVSLRNGMASSASSQTVDRDGSDSPASSDTAINEITTGCESPLSEIPLVSSGSGIPLASFESVGDGTPPMRPERWEALESKRRSSAASRYAPKPVLNSIRSSVASVAMMPNPFLDSSNENIHVDTGMSGRNHSPEMRSTARYLSSPSESSSMDGSGPFPRSASEKSSSLGDDFISEEEGVDVTEQTMQVDGGPEQVDPPAPSAINEIVENKEGDLCGISDDQNKCTPETGPKCEASTNDEEEKQKTGPCEQCVVDEQEDKGSMGAKSRRGPRWRSNWEVWDRFLQVLLGVGMLWLLLSCQSIRQGMGLAARPDPPVSQNSTASTWDVDWVNLTLDGVTCYTEGLRFTFGRGKCSKRRSKKEPEVVVETDGVTSKDNITNPEPELVGGMENQTTDSNNSRNQTMESRDPVEEEINTLDLERSSIDQLWDYVWSWRFVDYVKCIELWAGVVVGVGIGMGALGGWPEAADWLLGCA
ncbi:hypothetical protein BSKO_04358 [Bryopsis sp. KO-2023]|nr:hypothetical protein BSKO_04358 [Bryopsis sp. KO-2023]